jgi:predicted phage gp36 major capsid-like protein
MNSEPTKRRLMEEELPIESMERRCFLEPTSKEIREKIRRRMESCKEALDKIEKDVASVE